MKPGRTAADTLTEQFHNLLTAHGAGGITVDRFMGTDDQFIQPAHIAHEFGGEHVIGE